MERFTVQLEVRIRRCREGDLATLQWFGLFAPEVIEEQFQRHLAGTSAILVADANGVASGQVWIDYARIASEGIGVVWALRVFPNLQGLGVGSRLVRSAQRLIRRQGGTMAELEVHLENSGARRLYQRLGYREIGPADGNPQHILMRKPFRLRKKPKIPPIPVVLESPNS